MVDWKDDVKAGDVVAYYSVWAKGVIEFTVCVVSPDHQYFMTTSYPPSVLRCDQVEVVQRNERAGDLFVRAAAETDGDPRQAWAKATLGTHFGGSYGIN